LIHSNVANNGGYALKAEQTGGVTMPMVDTSLYGDQLAAMTAAGEAFEQASNALDTAEDQEDKASCAAARAAIQNARKAWETAAMEVGRRVHMQVAMIEGHVV
jgi:hypothetical protein